MPNTDSVNRFSASVDRYVRFRPSYPAKVFQILEDATSLNLGSVVADIGSGPGHLAQLFLERNRFVFAVEPNEEMRQAGIRALSKFPQFRSVPGTAEATTLPDASVDLLTAAESFHWFDPVLARQEFLRVLKSGGHLALVWNLSVGNPIFYEAHQIIGQYRQWKPLAKKRVFRDKDDLYSQVKNFFGGGFRTDEVEHHQLIDEAHFCDRLLTSIHLEPGSAETDLMIRADLHRLFQKHQESGTVPVNYIASVHFGPLEG